MRRDTRRRALLGIVLAAVVAAAAAAIHTFNHDRQVWRRAKVGDVRETVLFYEMAFLYPSHAYFVETGAFGETRAAPSDAFLRRFQNSDPPVLPAPAHWSPAVDGRGRFQYQGKTAALVSVGSVHWNFDGSADVDGGAQCGGQCGTYGVFHVVCHHDDWYVTDYESQVGI